MAHLQYKYSATSALAMDSVKISHGSEKVIDRPSAIFSPSLWGGFFDSFTVNNQIVEMYEKEIEKVKKEVKSMQTTMNPTPEKLNLIDILERLGISYHFEKEIEEQLEEISNAGAQLQNADHNNDLATVALRFRLLRQHGFNITSGIFNYFKDKDGKFKEIHGNDIKDLLNLFEAAHTKIHGEEILNEALSFTTANLRMMESDLPLHQSKQVSHTLDQPFHKGILRIEARHNISVYEEDESKIESVLKLAKLDYNLLQILHRKELCEVSRWWKELALMSKLPYARDRVVECYFWTLGVYFEPQYSLARIMLTKTIAMISVIDDTFDSYGTVEELQLFNDAVQRWDIRQIDHLPHYMKELYPAILDLYEEYDEALKRLGRSYAVSHAKERMKEIVNSYFVEAKWFIEGYTPKFEEYLNNALITSTYYLLTTTSLLGMESATEEAYEWLMTNPKIMIANVTICRLADDMATYEIEKERGQITTGIECYMKQYGVSKAEAMNACNKMVEDAWMDLNEGCLRPRAVPVEILMRVLNLVRIIDVVYKNNEDGYTNPEKVLKPHIMALLVDAINI